jgi:phosphatidylglycerophosphatase A
MTRLALLTATAGYAGHFPVAPGTAGSAVGLLLFYLIRLAGGGVIEAIAIVAVFVAGVWAAGVAERVYGREDPGAVVIDEVLGMLVTLAFLPVSLTGALVGFFAFRVMDVVKPWPARSLERLHGGLGVMADDAMAAVYAYLVVRLACWAAPSWMIAA